MKLFITGMISLSSFLGFSASAGVEQRHPLHGVWLGGHHATAGYVRIPLPIGVGSDDDRRVQIDVQDKNRRPSPITLNHFASQFDKRDGPDADTTPPTQADKIDEYIEEEMRKQHIPGLSLAVVHAGNVVKTKGYGLANMELNVHAAPDTVYQLQSITKSFVAFGIMLLVEDGKLGLDDKITSHLSGMPQAWSGVSVRHLLTHTSGIPNFVSDQGSGKEIVAFAQKASSSEEIVEWAAGRPLKFEPGEGRRYSSTGYHLLGMIIEKVTGKPWGQFLHERIFAPLEMTRTRVYSSSDIITNRASGYVHFGNAPQNGVWMTPAIMESAAGGLVSTVQDLSRWEIALQAGTILKPSTFAQMEAPITLNNGSIVQEKDGTRYGLGWDLQTYQGHRLVRNGGDHVTGFTANFSRFPDDRLAVIVLTNLMPLEISDIAKRIAGFYVAALTRH
jgi:D-alanyl-D-alanine carboxypeptidase